MILLFKINDIGLKANIQKFEFSENLETMFTLTPFECRCRLTTMTLLIYKMLVKYSGGRGHVLENTLIKVSRCISWHQAGDKVKNVNFHNVKGHNTSTLDYTLLLVPTLCTTLCTTSFSDRIKKQRLFLHNTILCCDIIDELLK